MYDVSSRASFDALPTFLNDARALAGQGLTVVLAGNKVDVDDEREERDEEEEGDHEDASTVSSSRASRSGKVSAIARRNPR